METETKLSKLKESFPEIPDGSLLEILITCGGSVSQARLIIEENVDVSSVKRRKITTHQSTLSLSCPKNPSTPRGSSPTSVKPSKSLTLYSKNEIESNVPYLTFEKNFLPSELADGLLMRLKSMSEEFSPNEFYIAGKKCQSNHLTAFFRDDDSSVGVSYLAGDLGSRTYFDELKMSELLVNDYVQQVRSNKSRLPFEHDELVGNTVVVNKYDAKSNNLMWHSDKMTYIGPQATIVSLSLGATRVFQVRKCYPHKGNHNPIISIPLPHNSLLIMHSGTQEEYKHCVNPLSRDIELHEMSGITRFNLTFRYQKKEFVERAPKCHCGNQMNLGRVFKDPKMRGKYYWKCNASYKNNECSGFHWANFSNESLISKKEEDGSEWVADDDNRQ